MAGAAALRDELERLRCQLEDREKLISQLTLSWEQKRERTLLVEQQQSAALEALGISLPVLDQGSAAASAGVAAARVRGGYADVGGEGALEAGTPFLVNLNEDPLFSECLRYPLRCERPRCPPIHPRDIHPP